MKSEDLEGKPRGHQGEDGRGAGQQDVQGEDSSWTAAHQGRLHDGRGLVAASYVAVLGYKHPGRARFGTFRLGETRTRRLKIQRLGEWGDRRRPASLSVRPLSNRAGGARSRALPLGALGGEHRRFDVA